jgi:hypothetical protein
MVYHIPSTFDKAAGKNSNRKSASFGSSDRFQSPGSYLKINNNTTGPGHYSTSDFSRPSSRYGTIGPTSPTKADGRLKFRQSEGADAAYNVRSSFDFNQVVRFAEGCISFFFSLTPLGLQNGMSTRRGNFGTSDRFSKASCSSHIKGLYSDAPGPGLSAVLNIAPAHRSIYFSDICHCKSLADV